jgi:hypothetical protein
MWRGCVLCTCYCRLAAELQEFNRLKQMEMSERERRER